MLKKSPAKIHRDSVADLASSRHQTTVKYETIWEGLNTRGLSESDAMVQHGVDEAPL
jgi:hypothetical protein